MSRRSSSAAVCIDDAAALLKQHAVGSPEWCWLMGIAPMKEASSLSGLSVDGLKRHHADKVKDLSERRCGMRRLDALTIGRSRNP